MASNMSFILVLALVALAAPSRVAAAGRGLLQSNNYGDEPQGNYANARGLSRPTTSSTRNTAITPESAESTVDTQWAGLYRLAPKEGSRVAVATVEADPLSSNPDRVKQLVQPRAQVAQDVAAGRLIDRQSGAPQVPTIALGTTVAAQTYMGATAVSTSDGVVSARQRPERTITARSQLTASANAVPRASAAGSYGSTNKAVTAAALSGAADGKLQLAQADNAVALAQSQRGDIDSVQPSTDRLDGPDGAAARARLANGRK